MAQFVDVVGQTLLGAVRAIGAAEADQMKVYVQAAKDIADGKPRDQVLLSLLAAKQPANFLAAAEIDLTMTANLSVQASKSLGVGIGGGIAGFDIHADLKNGSDSTEQSNTTITVRLTRLDSNNAVQKLVEGLTGVGDLFNAPTTSS